ncbi:glycosyltransferase family 2 protein [Stenomitos frigidus]|uniref:Glycosyltransferase family 2 protein n=1 Tax=Stenomitos frigidus ULC18 TaxID=2107698 RepID=A0A2T1EPI1_9CYAN|nr:glycosyltransferase family 2 protein [Stenomitos frigidus]PSB34652.1 glycosyltransferase family 2 protein [Stenomitos frigidus ULC18]
MNDNCAVLVSIILVNYNGANVMLECLRSLLQFLHSVPYEIIVVDNASTDGSAALVAESVPTVNLIKQTENRGFGSGNNVGAKHAKGEFLFFLNTDTLLINDVLPHLVMLMKNDPKIGIIGTKLLNADRSLQLSIASEISLNGEYQTLKQQKEYAVPQQREAIEQKFEQEQPVDIVIGAAFFIRRALFEALNGFDETFFMYFEESDLCQRARDQGWQVLYTPEVSIIHLGGYSVGKVSDQMRLEYRRSQLYYYQKHRPLWEQLVLRVYLAAKFAIATLKSSNPTDLKILRLILDFDHYPMRPNQTYAIGKP